MRVSMTYLIVCLAGLMVVGVSAMSPPAWVGPGTTVTYEAALTPYYAIDSDDPLERWVHYEGTGVYGFWIDRVTGWDETGYYGDATVISAFDGSTMVEGEWSYQPGDPGMGLFWVDLDGIAFSEENLVAEGPMEAAGEVWDAQAYYYASIGNTFDVRFIVDKESGLLLSKTEGLTGADGRMQRAIYLLQSIENPQPGMGAPEENVSCEGSEAQKKMGVKGPIRRG